MVEGEDGRGGERGAGRGVMVGEEETIGGDSGAGRGVMVGEVEGDDEEELGGEGANVREVVRGRGVRSKPVLLRADRLWLRARLRGELLGSKRGESAGRMSDSWMGLGEGNRGDPSLCKLSVAGRVVDMLCNLRRGKSGRGGEASRCCLEGESNGCFGIVVGLCRGGEVVLACIEV